MDDLKKGTWIINSNKQIKRLRADTAELSYFEAIGAAGKAGDLLARLVADETEVIPVIKVKAFARQCGISALELSACLEHLRAEGKVDYDRGMSLGVEVYCFSIQDALETTNKLYDRLEPSDYEEASLLSLEETFHLPRYRSDLISIISDQGFSEEVAHTTLDLQSSLGLVRTSDLESELLYYNEHAFEGNPQKITKALQALPSIERDHVETIYQLVNNSPGYLYDDLIIKFPEKLLRMMEGVGLLNMVPVKSAIGEAIFVTSPQLKGVSIGPVPISTDVFHKAKLLLSCLRFGEVKSTYSRGKIDTHEKMMNIVNKLIRGEEVGPATAIGQDYQLLEKQGVIATRQYPNDPRRYFMTLRQKEVGILVQQMLEFKRIVPEASMELYQLEQPTDFIMPEHRRTDILAEITQPVKEAQQSLLEALRT